MLKFILHNAILGLWAGALMGIIVAWKLAVILHDQGIGW